MENKNENEKVLTVQEKADELYNKKMTFVQWLRYFDKTLWDDVFSRRNEFGDSVVKMLDEREKHFADTKEKDDDAAQFFLFIRKLRRGVENGYRNETDEQIFNKGENKNNKKHKKDDADVDEDDFDILQHQNEQCLAELSIL